jgi:hypothetical protein
MLTRFPARTKIQIYLKPGRALSLPYPILSSPMRSCTWSFTEYSTMNRGYATRCSPDLATTSASVFFWPCAPSSAGALREENGPVLHMCCQMSSLWSSYYPHFAVSRHSYSLVKVQCRRPLSPPSRRAFRTLTHGRKPRPMRSALELHSRVTKPRCIKIVRYEPTGSPYVHYSRGHCGHVGARRKLTSMAVD